MEATKNMLKYMQCERPFFSRSTLDSEVLQQSREDQERKVSGKRLPGTHTHARALTWERDSII